MIAYLFAEGGVVVTLHAALVEGNWYNRISKSSQECEKGTGH